MWIGKYNMLFVNDDLIFSGEWSHNFSIQKQMKNKGKVTVFRTSKELQALCQYLWFSNKRVESLKAKVNSDGKKLHKDSSYGYQKWVLAKYSVNWDKS